MPVTISGMRSSSAIYVQQGGTGRATLQSGSLLVGNGADNVGLLAPGTEGQVLTVVSGAWKAANSAGGVGGGLSTVNTTGNITGDGSSGSPVALASNISLTSVSASFSGSGANLTNIPNAALQNSSITINGEAVSLGGTVNIVTAGGSGASVDYSLMNFTGSNFTVGDIVAMSGSLIKADYSGDMSSNVIGAVAEVSGNITTVKLYGEVTANSASAIAGTGTPVYIGPSGSVVEYSSIPSGNYITQVGFISPNSGKVILQPRVFGIKA